MESVMLSVDVSLFGSAASVSRTARVLTSQAEAIVRTGKTWPQATKRRTSD